jgi:hypothetical protein
MEWAMTDMDDETSENVGTRILTWAMIAGAALMFLEVTLSPAAQPVAKTATVHIVTVASAAHNDRLAQN